MEKNQPDPSYDGDRSLPDYYFHRHYLEKIQKEFQRKYEQGPGSPVRFNFGDPESLANTLIDTLRSNEGAEVVDIIINRLEKP